jgi:hypothetical protein
MSKPYFEEVFKYSIKEFESHLKDDRNERIIFSGKYGSGKTTFLNEYFSQEEISERYNVYRIFPINYSIASNEDIVRYIKHDLILELLKSGIQVSTVDLSYLRVVPWYLLDNPVKIIASIIKMIPKVGKSIGEYHKGIEELYEEIKKYKSEAEKDQLDHLAEYLDKLEQHEGGLYENDIITKYIINAISKLSERVSEDEMTAKKENILIVDDLDRLDPEHIFRILNVFAAHFENPGMSSDRNKFGFNKVIMVCDIGNIRNIFYHKHGPLVDFTGYIDKFYSSDIFYFDNRNAVASVVSKVINSFEYDTQYPGIKKLYLSVINSNGFLKELLFVMVSHSYVSLRSLLKIYGKQVTYFDDVIRFSRQSSLNVRRIAEVVQLRIIRDVLGDYNTMFTCFLKCKQANLALDYNLSAVGRLVLLTTEKEHHFSEGFDFEMQYLDDRYKINYRSDFENSSINTVKFSVKGKDQDFADFYQADEKMFWHFLCLGAEKLHSAGYLR